MSLKITLIAVLFSAIMIPLTLGLAQDRDLSYRIWKTNDGEPPDLDKTAKGYSNIVKIGEDRKSGTQVLYLEWDDPVLAAQWANKIVVALNEYLRSKAIVEAQNSIKYLKTELAIQRLMIEERNNLPFLEA